MAAEGQRTARSSGPGPLARTYRAWRGLAPGQRISALAAISLWVTMFLPWYSESAVSLGGKQSTSVSITLSAFDAFSFVELAVLAVSIAVLALLFARGEGRAFHLPGGDGTVILVAGAWVTLLILYRMIDKSSVTAGKNGVLSTGIQWGIFLALAAAIWLGWTGLTMRRAHRAEPSYDEDPTTTQSSRGGWRERLDAGRPRPVAARGDAATRAERAELTVRAQQPDGGTAERRTVTREDAEQLSFELPHDQRDD
jgi:hypothetical protein